MRPAARSSAALAVVLLLLPACSGGGSSSSGPTRSQFTQQALAICHSYQRRITDLQGSANLAQLAAQGRKAIALQQAELRELRALTPPQDDRDQIQRMLDAMDAATATAGALVDAAERGDAVATAAAAGKLRGQLEDVNRLAKPYGLDVCSG